QVAGLDRGSVRRAVRLEIEPLPLHEIPWELMQAPDGRGLLALDPGLQVFHRAGSRRAAETFAVRWLQRALSTAGASIIIDGVLGPQTKNALREFQRANGLQPTGAFDAVARAALETRLRAE